MHEMYCAPQLFPILMDIIFHLLKLQYGETGFPFCTPSPWHLQQSVQNLTWQNSTHTIVSRNTTIFLLPHMFFVVCFDLI